MKNIIIGMESFDYSRIYRARDDFTHLSFEYFSIRDFVNGKRKLEIKKKNIYL